MPNLNFYAVNDDHRAVLAAVFDLGVFRVFEAYSQPDCDLREFHDPDEIVDSPGGWHLMLYTRGAGPEPTAHRIDIRPGDLGDATFRYSCEGWGLVQLYFGHFFQERELRWSHTNHNTEKRAAKWGHAVPELDDPGRWNFAAVTSASGKLNRTIRKMAVSKIAARPVLPRAAQLITDIGLRYEYGTGIHRTPLAGHWCTD